MKTSLPCLRVIAPLLLLSIVSAASGQAADARRVKKLIATGWDKPDTRRLVENLDVMEKRPFDGVMFQVTGRREDGKSCGIRAAFVNEKWQRAWFQPCVDDLKACKCRRFADNFASLGANPGNVDWFDDAGWKNIVDHWRTAAWIVKQSGIRGILFDPEPYTPPHAQFRYPAQPDREKHTFDEYYAKARQRGREVIEAVVEECPRITIFCYFMNSVNATATGHADPRKALTSSGYGLYPAFIDGWLDAIVPSVTLVDGCESAYLFNSTSEYVEAALRIKGDCQELVSPENRAKYRAQVQVSFGVYLDAYWNPKDSKWGRWYIDGLGGPRVDRLRANVHTALRAADEYVWIYGEKFRWWPTPSGGVKQESWPEALPGCEKTLRFVRNPLEYARLEIGELEKAGKLVNLAFNGDFGSEKVVVADGHTATWREGGPPAGWGTWQTAASQGTFTWDRSNGAAAKGSARMAGLAEGCFTQHHKVEPGGRYVVRAVQKQQGRGLAKIRVRWQTPDGAWTAVGQDKIILAEGPAGQWNEMFAVVEVPDGAGGLVILLGAAGQSSADDVARFDDVALYKLP